MGIQLPRLLYVIHCFSATRLNLFSNIGKKSKSLFRSVDQTGNWDDIILDETLKRDLREDVIGFFSKESLYKGLAVPWKRGIILMGEPGNGKTVRPLPIAVTTWLSRV